MVGGSIVALTVDRGQAVTAGAEVARITSRDLEAARTSAQAAVRSAEIVLSVATARIRADRGPGEGWRACRARSGTDAQRRRAAEAQVAAATARVRSAEQQLDDTSVKAPFAGVVSARPASIGDVVAPGTPSC